MIDLITDGGCYPNPGPAYYSFKVIQDNEIVAEANRQHIGNATNNEAEYSGLLAGLEAVRERLNDGELHIYTDSRLMCNQVRGQWRCKKKHLNPLVERAQKMLSGYNWRIEWLPRDFIFGYLGH